MKVLIVFAPALTSARLLVFPGFQEMFFVVGNDAGATLWGVLFYHIGTRGALLFFAALTGVLLVSLVIYVRFSKKASEYEKISQEDDDDYDDDSC